MDLPYTPEEQKFRDELAATDISTTLYAAAGVELCAAAVLLATSRHFRAASPVGAS